MHNTCRMSKITYLLRLPLWILNQIILYHNLKCAYLPMHNYKNIFMTAICKYHKLKMQIKNNLDISEWTKIQSCYTSWINSFINI